jgi:hypothetical protein
MRRASALALAVLITAGCSAEHPRALAKIDDRGLYRGVGIGDTQMRVMRRLGRVSPGYELAPSGEHWYQFGGPPSIAAPRRCPRRFRRPFLRYHRVVYMFSCDRRIYAVLVTQPGARTSRGVRIGDSLRAARKIYRGLKCGEGVFGELPSTRYPYCAGKIGRRRFISFGPDPIRSITIASTPLPANIPGS